MKTMLIVIQNQADHEAAKRLAAQWMVSDDPDDKLRLTAQARLIEDYERRQWPRRPVSLAALLHYLMEAHDLTRADLVPLLGTASRVSEVLAGKRGLSLKMVQRLRRRFRIPADLLLPSADVQGRASRKIAA